MSVHRPSCNRDLPLNPFQFRLVYVARTWDTLFYLLNMLLSLYEPLMYLLAIIALVVVVLAVVAGDIFETGGLPSESRWDVTSLQKRLEATAPWRSKPYVAQEICRVSRDLTGSVHSSTWQGDLVARFSAFG